MRGAAAPVAVAVIQRPGAARPGEAGAEPDAAIAVGAQCAPAQHEAGRPRQTRMPGFRRRRGAGPERPDRRPDRRPAGCIRVRPGLCLGGGGGGTQQGQNARWHGRPSRRVGRNPAPPCRRVALRRLNHARRTKNVTLWRGMNGALPAMRTGHATYWHSGRANSELAIDLRRQGRHLGAMLSPA